MVSSVSRYARHGRTQLVVAHQSADSRSFLIISSSNWFSLPEALTGLVLPLPYLFASAAYSSAAASDNSSFPPLSAYAQLKQATDADGQAELHHASSLLQAATLTSGTLLMIGILARIRSEERVLDRRKNSHPSPRYFLGPSLSVQSLKSMAASALSVGLPYYAAIQLGGVRVGLMVLTAIASALICSHAPAPPMLRPATLGVMLLCLLADMFGLTIHADAYHLLTGYLAMAVSLTVLPPPLPLSNASSSFLAGSPSAIATTLYAGALLSLLTIGASIFLSLSPPVTLSSIAFSTLSMAATAGLALFASPSILRSKQKSGLAAGALLTAASSFLFSPSIWPGTICNGALSALSCVAVLYDTSSPSHAHHDHSTDAHSHSGHAHCQHHHDHHPSQPSSNVSFVTTFLLSCVEPGSLVHSILCEKDSRRIAYFTWYVCPRHCPSNLDVGYLPLLL